MRYSTFATNPELEVTHADPTHETRVSSFLLPFSVISPRNWRAADSASRDFEVFGTLVAGERVVPMFFEAAMAESRADGTREEHREHIVVSQAADILRTHGFEMPRVKALA